jgi:hypothetical protein
MARGRRLLGRLVLMLAVMAAAFVGAKLGLLGTREVGADHNFADVPSSIFYHDFVDYLAQSGVTAGCGAGLFCGEQAVTRGQMAVFLGLLRLVAGCPPDSIRVAGTCLDKYEASVWVVPPGNASLIQKIRLGTVTLAELQAGGSQRGVGSDDFGVDCPDTGDGCVNFYAVSIAGVRPSGFLTWFQAAAAARNAGKRLPTNAEWQAAALGTPDPGSAPGGEGCNTVGGISVQAGTRANCVSDAGAFDMVGNLEEWVADWVALSTGCVAALFGTGDLNCVAGASTADGPGPLRRGGHFTHGASAGVFAVVAGVRPDSTAATLGFRGAR